MFALGLSNGSLNVGGSPAFANYIHDVNSGIGFYEQSRSRINIINNKIERIHGSGVFFAQGTAPPEYFLDEADEGTIYIMNNFICQEGNYYNDGISLLDFLGMEDPSKASEVFIRNNTIRLTKPDQTAVYHYGGAEAKILNNTILGVAHTGLYFDSKNWVVMNNDFRNFTSDWEDIYLGTETQSNRVICPFPTTICNEGVDNILLGRVELVERNLKSKIIRPGSNKYYYE